jgi:hypothetical protein
MHKIGSLSLSHTHTHICLSLSNSPTLKRDYFHLNKGLTAILFDAELEILNIDIILTFWEQCPTQ